VIPVELRDRPLRDGLVVEALERWAAGEASQILVDLFVVAGIVTLLAVPPGLALGGRARMLANDRPGAGRDEQEPATRADDAADSGAITTL
jgi:hypothetical protein